MRLHSEHDRVIARLAVPALGTLVAEPLYVLTDTAIVGRIGTTELAGLALASTVLLTAHAVLIFLAYGTTAAVARLIGAERVRDAADRSVQALWLAVGFGLAVIVLLVVFGTPLLELLGGEGEVLVAAELYLGISVFGFPFLLLMMSASGSFHGRQNTVTPLFLAVTGALANLIIEVVLIYGFGYGLGASALSTVIAQIGTATVAVWLVLRWSTSVGVGPRPNWATMKSLLDAGKALVVRTVALRGSFTLSAAVAARIGVAELAAHQIVLQVWGTLALALDAVAIAGQSLTGTFLGSGDVARARGAARRMIEIDVVFGALAGVVLVAARHPIAELFSTDPDVVSLTAFILLFVAAQQPVNSVVFALDGILIGAGDLAYLARTMVAATAIFAGLALSVLWTGAGLGWLWAALGCFMLLRAGFMWWRWRDDVWLVTGAA
jgi:putative MATE family efflux protein